MGKKKRFAGQSPPWSPWCWTHSQTVDHSIHCQLPAFSGSIACVRACIHRQRGGGEAEGGTACKQKQNTYLRLGVGVERLAEHEEGDVVLAGLAEDGIRHRRELRGPDGEPRLLERLALGARKDGLAVLEVAAGKLPGAVAVATQPLAYEESAGGGMADHGADADAGVAGRGCRDAHLGRYVFGGGGGVVVIVVGDSDERAGELRP